jgi:hypothetical protein
MCGNTPNACFQQFKVQLRLWTLIYTSTYLTHTLTLLTHLFRFFGLCFAQVAAELDKGTLQEPPAGWIRPGDVAEGGGGGDESGSSGAQQ